jgi:lambda repressor-like predicted transcriptional regulator
MADDEARSAAGLKRDFMEDEQSIAEYMGRDLEDIWAGSL